MSTADKPPGARSDKIAERFRCGWCGARKLQRSESGSEVFGVEADAFPRLYVCGSCKKVTLTFERVHGPYSMRYLP